MLSVYMNSPNQRVSVHRNPNCIKIPKQHKPYQRVIHIDSTNVESKMRKLRNKELTFKAKSGFNDVWFYINLDNASLEENLVITIQKILGQFYMRIANAEIQDHCLDPSQKPKKKAQHIPPPAKGFKHPLLEKRKTVPDRENKINDIINTITERISDINSQYRSGPSLYFYRRIIEQRRKYPKINSFISDGYNLELLYAVLVSWDMDSRGAKMKYFDDFKSNLTSCLLEFEVIENKSKNLHFALGNEMLDLLKKAYLKLELMETSCRFVSNSKCLHFLFPALFMPMDGSNTLQYLFNNSYESPNRYLDIIKFQFEIMQQPVNLKKYLDDRWNQSIPKLIDNAIILLRGISVKRNPNRSHNSNMINSKKQWVD